jgi:hypothetical protein
MCDTCIEDRTLSALHKCLTCLVPSSTINSATGSCVCPAGLVLS